MGIPAWANAADIERLRAAILALHESMDRSSRTLVRLTWALVLLTFVIAVLTTVLLFD
jgi:membrane-anchored glycerophosphoryl diester phosphodiesterase (GDPDase)